ncbi:MAG TPA: UDP-N-acetylmuramoyl-L-alanine--D-glutamate ligase [Candidatus Polarisedimenticolaceae bacterium]|nr:UDP-N-acetylmuramoyl-L-alanine--D-glutamate ligase [Candidatus Polarisedimenticolaceae bacterium]
MNETTMKRQPFATRNPDLRNRRVLVLGMGKSGLAAARLAAAHGARVTIADRKPAERLGDAIERARRTGAQVHPGGHPASLVDRADLVVVSPGVPGGVEPLVAARRAGVPVWSEIELAARFCRGRVVGITGSNGKSTVTAMTGAILRRAGVPGGTGGNLDVPFCDLLEHDADNAVHAVELSSFQLEHVESFSPGVAAVLNLTPDHLDRYPDLDAYAAAKARLLEVQQPGAAAILNADDGSAERFRPAVRGRLYLFSVRRPVDQGAFVRDSRLVLRTAAGEETLFARDELPLPGEHNVANALAAALAARLVGCRLAAVAAALRDYRALPHRLEHVGRVGGVEFYNDSKATNPDSTMRAIEAFEPGRVVLILGGRDKGADWDALVDGLVARRVRVMLVGEAAAMLSTRLASRVPVIDCGTIPRAVERGFADAGPGDVVLLSPGCASFDQFDHFIARGDAFRQAVERLEPPEVPDA